MRFFLVALMVGGCGGGDDEVPPGTGLCQVTSDCDEGLVCISGVCGAVGSVTVGDPCTASRDCMAGSWCAPALPVLTCQTAGDGAVGDPCGSDAACQGGLRCQLYGFSGECVEGGSGEKGGACSTNADCLAGLFCGAAAACTDFLDAYPPFGGVDCPADDGPFRVFFEVPRAARAPADFFRLPFPNDVRVRDDGTLDLSDFPRPGPTPLGVDLVDLYADAWSADFEGFSATAVVTFRFSAQIDFATTEIGGAVRYVDVTAGPSFGANLGLAWSYTSNRGKYLCENPLTVRNDVITPLTPGHTYAVILSRDIRSRLGAVPAAPDPDFAAMVSATRPSADGELAAAWDEYQPLRDVLPVVGMAAGDVAAAAVFTVQDTTGHMKRLADSVAVQPPPVLSDLTVCDQGVTSPCDDGTAQRACGLAQPGFFEIHGRMTIPIYQAGTPPYLAPADGGRIVETGGVPEVARTEEVCFALTIPKTPMPAAGWPLMVHHHGTGGSMRGFIGSGIAQTMASGRVPTAVLGFDAVEHGARRGGATISPDHLVFNALNPWAARDNFLQGAVDVLQALRVASIVIPAGTSPTGQAIAFDAGKVHFFGHSQGATSGTLAVAFSATAPAMVLSGAGSFLTDSLQDKKSPVDLAAGLEFLLGERLTGDHPVMTIFQSWFDRSDPVNYDLLLLRTPPVGIPSKHIFMAYGLDDTYSPKSTLDVTALSTSLPPVVPVLSDIGEVAGIPHPVTLNRQAGDGQARTAACFQYTPDGYDGHFVATDNADAVADWSAFLQSWLETGTPTVP